MTSEKFVGVPVVTPGSDARKTFDGLPAAQRAELLRGLLAGATPQVRLLALAAVSEDIAESLLEELKKATEDRVAEVRAAALGALRFVDTRYIHQVIADGLRDSDREVRRAAAELFHGSKRAA